MTLNDMPHQLITLFAFHQQEAVELGGDEFARASEEGLAEALGVRGGYGCGCVRKC